MTSSVFLREKSSRSLDSLQAPRDEKFGVPGKCGAFFGVEYRKVCLMLCKGEVA